MDGIGSLNAPLLRAPFCGANNTVSFITSQEASRFALTIGKSGKSNLLLFARGNSLRKGKGTEKHLRQASLAPTPKNHHFG